MGIYGTTNILYFRLCFAFFSSNLVLPGQSCANSMTLCTGGAYCQNGVCLCPANEIVQNNQCVRVITNVGNGGTKAHFKHIIMLSRTFHYFSL